MFYENFKVKVWLATIVLFNVGDVSNPIKTTTSFNQELITSGWTKAMTTTHQSNMIESKFPEDGMFLEVYGDYRKSIEAIGILDFGEYIKKQVNKMLNLTIDYFPIIEIDQESIKVRVESNHVDSIEKIMFQIERLVNKSNACFANINGEGQLCIRQEQDPFEVRALEVSEDVKREHLPWYLTQFGLNLTYIDTVDTIGYETFCHQMKIELINYFEVPEEQITFVGAVVGNCCPLVITTRFEPGYDEGNVRGQKLINDWKYAVRNGTFCLYVPPIDDHKTCAVLGAFLLSRFYNPEEYIFEGVRVDKGIVVIRGAIALSIIIMIIIGNHLYTRYKKKKNVVKPKGNGRLQPKV